jgi:hypothetical protein
MIIPAIFIEGIYTVDAIYYSINCLRESVSSLSIISTDDLDTFTFNSFPLRTEASMEISSQMNTITEKWMLSYPDNFFSLSLQRIFSIKGNYYDYRNLGLLAKMISDSLFGTKIYFNRAGLGLYTADLYHLKNELTKLDGYGKSIFWDS